MARSKKTKKVIKIIKNKIIQALGGIIVGNSIFTLFGFVINLWSMYSNYLFYTDLISKVSISNLNQDTSLSNFQTFLNSTATANYQITTWTIPVSYILWLIWLFLCFTRWNETEIPKTNLISLILHYILGMIFLIPLLYLPYQCYKKLFIKATGTNSKLLLFW